MDEGERFAKLFDLVIDIFKSYMANYVWTAGLVCVSIGWFLGSESSRSFIHESRPAMVGAILVVLVVGAVHTVSSAWFRTRSREVLNEISEKCIDLAPLPVGHYEIRASILAANLVVVWALLIGLIIFIITAGA